MSIDSIAHVTDDGRRHSLAAHLFGTAKRAALFATVFGFRNWGWLAGLWHDLGKFGNPFQKKIEAAAGSEAHLEAKAKVDHSAAGALHAISQMGIAGRILAYIIAGHHAGLPDWESDRTGRAALFQRLLQKELLETAMSANIPIEILKQPFPDEKPIGRNPAFWIRMLFSCLVDADFLDTEEFFSPEKSTLRGRYPSLPQLLSCFAAYMADKKSMVQDSIVNRCRAEILMRCEEVAREKPGIFSLTVPTGGGKTLSSMAFSLQHAIIHDKRRIIYVIPFTSIIEQSADQFRQIFGDSVVEHHSNLDVTQIEHETSRSRLASENWDAPIIVTTNVQFFESIYSSRTSRCRKLHNIAGSVVVLDEAQLIPPEFLSPILLALNELVKFYGVTIILCTATQPALASQESPNFSFIGLDGIREIMENPENLFDKLKRVSLRLSPDIHESKTWDKVAEALLEHPSVLCIVNRRDDCRHLWNLMPKDTFHLSALMCGAHRSKKIEEIKAHLRGGYPTRVISTQLVEAGVDLDFPVVYRAMAGLDSIAQAAGRCNREGLLQTGELHIFTPPTLPPVGLLRQAAGIGARLLKTEGDPLAPKCFTAYFKELYWLQGADRLDQKGILMDLTDSTQQCRFSFRTAAKKFRMIDDALQAPVIVSYGEGASCIEQLKRMGPERWLLRKLQRYVVNLPKYLHQRLCIEGAIFEIHPGIYVQGHGALYDEDIGFCADKSLVYEPDELIT